MPSFFCRVARCASLCILLLAFLSACAHAPDKVSVGIGTAGYVAEDAAPFAKLYLPYARMASLAYVNPQPFGGNRYCPTQAWLDMPGSWDASHDPRYKKDLKRWLGALAGEWRCLFGGGPVKCPPGLRCSQGLQYHVWLRGRCEEAVVAFRGTDPGDRGDLLSNLHWFLGAWVVDDYAQAQSLIPDILNKLGCRPKRIIATGHSLAGGLAQHVAYSDPRIDYVYAFDSSPVTALFAVPEALRTAANSKLGIDRVYEAGEILSFTRYAASAIFPSSSCRPRVRIVRFAIATISDPVKLHNMPSLTASFETLARSAKPGTALPHGYAAARDCNLAIARQN